MTRKVDWKRTLAALQKFLSENNGIIMIDDG